MSTGKNLFSDAIDEIIDEIQNDKEDQQISLASDYIGLFTDVSISSVEDFVKVIQELLDYYIDDEYALRIIDVVNEYISSWGEFTTFIKEKNGRKSAIYKEVCLIGSYIDSPPPIKNIWEMKKTSKDIFNKFLAIVSKNNSDSIPKPTIVRMALLRFYIRNLLLQIQKEIKNCPGQVGMCLIDAFNAGAAITELNLAFRLLGNDMLELLHKIGARANKNERDSNKYKEICKIAKDAWTFGCELLHTQMFHLFLLNGNIVPTDEKDETFVKNKLKKIAPQDRLYGSGAVKTIDACPCNNSDECPLIKNIKPQKRYDLPVSKKNKKNS